MNDEEKLKAAVAAACCAYLDADRGVTRTREALNAAHEAREDALDAVILADALADAAVANCSNARADMFSAARALIEMKGK